MENEENEVRNNFDKPAKHGQTTMMVFYFGITCESGGAVKIVSLVGWGMIIIINIVLVEGGG